MTDEELRSIGERADAATPGPWEISCGYSCQQGAIIRDADDNEVVDTRCYDCRGDSLIVKDADAEFIAHAREDIPALLDEVDRLRKEVEWLETLVPGTIILESEDE